MEIIDNINQLLGDNLKQTITPGSKLKIAASCFSIYAYEALKQELESIESLEFVFTSPTFVPHEVTDQVRKERREFHIPKAERERSFYGSEFEIQLKNKLTQRAIAKECADWMRRKATFRSNRGTAPMQQFACVQNGTADAVYMPLHGFTAVDLGYQQGDAVSNIVNKMDEPIATSTYLNLFDQVWNDPDKLHDVTDRLCDHIDSIYKENSPERIYFLMLYNIFNEFLEDLNDDVLPNDMTGYRDSLIWQKLFNFQRDAATGIINKLETYNGCILADSVGLGKTFSALAVIKYYELRNRSVLVLCPKKLADNWLTFNRNLKTNLFAKDRFNYDVLCHTDLQRTTDESFGTPLNRINWGNYDLVVIDESHNFRNNEAFKERETRYERLMNSVIKAGVKTKVLMLSATPVNNRFSDLRNQLALAYEGDTESINKKLNTERDINEIFRRAQATFNTWSKLPPEERTAETILSALDFDFFELLDSVTIARSRRHIETFYDTSEIGPFPERRKPLSFHCQLTHRSDVIGFNEIFRQLSLMNLAVYAPISYILPSRLAKYEALYDTEVEGGKSKFKQVDRERSLQALMTVNLLKRLESSVEAFRLTLQRLQANHRETLAKIDEFNRTGSNVRFTDATVALENADPDEDDVFDPDGAKIGGKVQISLADMDVLSWEHDLRADLVLIDSLLSEMAKITPADDAKLQHLKIQIESKFASPINPGNKKILIFTAFADTAKYLYDNLAEDILQTHQLHTGKVTGSDPPKSTLKPNYDFQSLLTLFSPRSKEKAAILPDEPGEIDVLIGTDCISEGQNLQDCDTVINYDIHWNPVRIIQRFGRIDRIGSTNTSIQLINYWPDITLDEYINLKERVESRMVIADVTATGDDNVLTAKANEVSYRKEQLRRLQEEVIEMEDLKTGVSITDLGLNDFRMDLLNYVKENAELATVPSGMHAVVPAAPERGLPPGVIFTLRNRHHSVNVGGQNRLHPYYLIYIDPPYNTGNDFIYRDDFKESAEDYFERSNQRDELGNHLVANTDSNGRFHSDWLSMLCPRLRLAVNLLSDDGVILISIDDGEVGNLRKVCDELFGEERFIAQFIWKSRQNKDNRSQNGASIDHEYVLAYGKTIGGSERNRISYSNPDSDPRGDWTSANMVGLATSDRRPNLHYDLIDPVTGNNYGCPKMGWRYEQNTMSKLMTNKEIIWPDSPDGRPRRKAFYKDLSSGFTGYSSLIGKDVYTRNGTADIEELFGRRVMDFPKPVALLKELLEQGCSKESDIVLDFFSGAATTAHAVMAINAEDGGRRRYIMVQLPELCDESSEAFRAGYATIAELGKERIRRAGKQLKENNVITAPHLDVGFRVLKVDTSNMKDVYYAPDGVKQVDLLDQIENIKEDRTPEDLLFQVLLDWGVDLSLPIAKETIEGKTVFFVDGNALAACFDSDINEELVKKLAARKPLRVVFRDSGYGNDSVKINVEQIFKLISPSTDVKSI